LERAEVKQALRGQLTRIRPLRLALLTAVALLLTAYPFVVKDLFLQHVAILVLITATAAVGWNVLGGMTGQISFGHAIFFGIGAYTTVFLFARYGTSPWLGIVAGALLAAAVGLAIGFPVFRLRSHYFSIATIALQQVVFTVVINQDSLGGAAGIQVPIADPSLGNLQFSVRDQTGYHLVALAMFSLASLAVFAFARSRAGAYCRAVRDDDEAARSLGVPARRYKLSAMCLSAAITAVAGSVYAMYSLYADPNIVFSLNQSITIVLVAVLGGVTSLWGPLIGAIALVLIQEETRVYFSGNGTGLDLVIYGAVVIAIALLEPAGLVGLGKRVVRRLRRSPAALPAQSVQA
jgi:branched-chain amino acid transport system permease protein